MGMNLDPPQSNTLVINTDCTVIQRIGQQTANIYGNILVFNLVFNVHRSLTEPKPNFIFIVREENRNR